LHRFNLVGCRALHVVGQEQLDRPRESEMSYNVNHLNPDKTFVSGRA